MRILIALIEIKHQKSERATNFGKQENCCSLIGREVRKWRVKGMTNKPLTNNARIHYGAKF